MKAIVLQHTDWMGMMEHCWRMLESMTVIEIPIPVDATPGDTGLSAKISRLIIDMAGLEGAAFILDVNGAGVLPMDESFARWTPDEAPCPWVEWWWDDPVAGHTIHNFPGRAADYNRVLRSPNMIHCAWDATLARELAKWLGKECRHVPTATHPGFFSPDAARLSGRDYGRPDVSFMGTFYTEPDVGDASELAEASILAGERLRDPALDYFDIKEKFAARLPRFAGDFAANPATGPFNNNVLRWRGLSNHALGASHRNRLIRELDKAFDNTLFLGFNWPQEIRTLREPVYQPAHLSNIFRSTLLNIDLRNSQSFSGTNMRAYEIMSAGAAAALSYFPDFDPEGKLDGELYFHFDTIDKLHELAKFCRAHPEKTAAMGEKARDYVIQNHSWLARLQKILGLLPFA